MNSSFIGVPELVIMLTLAAFWAIPVIAGIWALVTLHRIRTEQQTIMAKLDAIERLATRA
jgi:hypothetical protein